MQIKRRAITVGTTFFLAAATGHVMQNGETISARLRGIEAPSAPVLVGVTSTAATLPAATPAPPAPITAAFAPAEAANEATRLATTDAAAKAAPEPAPDAVSVPVLAAAGLPDFPKAEPVALGADLRLAGRIEGLDAGYARASTAADANYSVFGIVCADPALSLEPSARGMMRATLAAPCFANERVTITHAGLVFAMATDQAGDLEVMLPALSPKARVDVRFASGDAVSASRSIGGLDALARIGVQWQGAEGFHLHAFEQGAGFDQPGHVSAAGPRDRATSEGGFLTALGDPAVDHPLMAEVYTAPAGTALDGMLVEAPVTQATCGRLLSGQTVRMVPGRGGVTETLSLAMPGCDAAGDSLMLGLAPVAVPAVAMATGTVGN